MLDDFLTSERTEMRPARYPEVMDEMYQWQHERGIAKLAELKQLIDSCK